MTPQTVNNDFTVTVQAVDSKFNRRTDNPAITITISSSTDPNFASYNSISIANGESKAPSKNWFGA